MEDSREEHWKDVDEDGEDNSKIHALRGDVYTIDKEELIKIEFSMSIRHPKRGRYC